MTYREIEIRGSLMERHYEPGSRIGNGRAVFERCVVAGDIVRQVDAAEADGVRSLLLVIDSIGGNFAAGLEVFRRLRAYSQAGGHVIAFIEGRAASTAPLVAQAADRVFMAADARLVVHGAHAPEGREAEVAHVNRTMARLLAERTGMPIGRLEIMCSETEVYSEMHAAGAVRLGWADAEPFDLDGARQWARLAAIPGAMAAPDLATRRSRHLAALAAGVLAACGPDALEPAPSPEVAAHLTQSSDGGTSQWGPYWNETRLHETALGNWTARTVPAGIWQRLATNGSRILAVRATATSGHLIYSDDDGASWAGPFTISAHSYRDVAFNGAVFCAVSDETAGVSATSASGGSGTWTQRTNMPTGIAWRTIAAVGSNFVAYGYQIGGGAGQFITRSTDGGVTWSAALTLTTTAAVPGRIAVAGDTLVATYQTSTSTGAACWQSTDGGQTWTARTIHSGALTFSTSVPVGHDGEKFVAAVQLGSTASGPYTLLASTTGETWGQIGSTPYGGGAFFWTSRLWVAFTSATVAKFATSWNGHGEWTPRSAVIGSVSAQHAGIWTGTRAVTVGTDSATQSHAL